MHLNVSIGSRQLLHILCALFGAVVWSVVQAELMPRQAHAPLPIDPVTGTISDIHDALVSRNATVTDILNIYLSRITTVNPQINALVTLNPNVLLDSHGLDDEISSSINPLELIHRKPLFGVPILLKDNYDATGMATTAGCLALKNATPTTDGPAVMALKQAGALIIGKTNLHELALEGLSVSSLGGQTLNPYDLTRTPGGSSGGSGAALAAGLTVLATGTDTVNSLRSPASANGLYSCRPTRGLISRTGVVSLLSSPVEAQLWSRYTRY